VLELPPFALIAVIGPVAAGIGRRSAQAQLAPLFIALCVVSARGREDDIVHAEVDRFLRTQPGVIHDREECDESGPAWLLLAHYPGGKRLELVTAGTKWGSTT
jgi:hypothetical protein